MKHINKKYIYIWLFIIYIIIVFYGTVIGRPVYHRNPFGKFWEDWTVYYRWKHLHYNSVVNILLLIPYGMFGAGSFQKLRNSHTMLIVSLAMSLFIETNQLLFHKGTVQLSDLVYNTLSGLIGLQIYNRLCIRKIISP